MRHGSRRRITTLEVPGILAWSLVGMLTGAIATQFLTSRGYGMGGDIGIGVLGALVGGLEVSLLGLRGQGGLVASTAAAFAGAVVLTWLARRVLRRRAPAARSWPRRRWVVGQLECHDYRGLSSIPSSSSTVRT